MPEKGLFSFSAQLNRREQSISKKRKEGVPVRDISRCLMSEKKYKIMATLVHLTSVTILSGKLSYF
jgi:hypothetical protein